MSREGSRIEHAAIIQLYCLADALGNGEISPQVPLVDYLALKPTPDVVAHECVSSMARYFDHRYACASCFGEEFGDVAVPSDGEVTTFTIVERTPGVG